MRDETLAFRLTAGITAEVEAQIRREARVEALDDLTSADVELLCRLRSELERQLQPHRELLLRLLICTGAIAASVRMRNDITWAVLSALHLSRDTLDQLIAQEFASNFEILKSKV